MENQQELQQLVIHLKAEIYDVSKAFHNREKQLLELLQERDKTIEQLQQELEDSKPQIDVTDNILSDEVIADLEPAEQ